jgi:hypothetical protein
MPVRPRSTIRSVSLCIFHADPAVAKARRRAQPSGVAATGVAWSGGMTCKPGTLKV